MVRVLVKAKNQAAFNALVTAVNSGTTLGVSVGWAGGLTAAKASWLNSIAYIQVADGAALNAIRNYVSENDAFKILGWTSKALTIQELYEADPIALANAMIALG